MSKENQNMELVLIEDLGMQYTSETKKYKHRYGLYRCFCGKEFKCPIQSVKGSHTKSCGCSKGIFISKNKTTHNLSKTRLYKIWSGMIDRTTNNKSKAYKYYGKKGVSICKEWLSNINSFIDWALKNGYNDNLTIDRINPYGNYEPSNCRWVPMDVQYINKRLLREDDKSGYRGVRIIKQSKKWRATITVKKKEHHIGCFSTAKDAAIAYNNFILENKLDYPLNLV